MHVNNLLLKGSLKVWKIWLR